MTVELFPPFPLSLCRDYAYSFGTMDCICCRSEHVNHKLFRLYGNGPTPPPLRCHFVSSPLSSIYRTDDEPEGNTIFSDNNDVPDNIHTFTKKQDWSHRAVFGLFPFCALSSAFLTLPFRGIHCKVYES